MVGRGQAEIMGGGFYEPLLSLIPARDRVDQIQAFSDYLYRQFGRRAQGVWLTERVWEPGLIDSLLDAGIEYTVVDDTHFIYAGLSNDALTGYYLTENEGRILKIFPGNMKLRYLIPFHPVEEAVDFIKAIKPDSFRTLADDGEKFGLWPGTHEHVYTKGWLESFLGQVEAAGIKTYTFTEALQSFNAAGRVYLPCASYEEMGEWVLEPERHEILERVKEKCSVEERAFIQGGYFKNFMVKYPEANQLHKRMIYVSRNLGPDREARRELWRGQASCAYWHGIFGGLYLPHLRTALYEHLIAADNIGIDFSGARKLDFDCDGEEEIIFSNRQYFIVFKPRLGAAVELDLRPSKVNLNNVVRRRPESYHKKVLQADDQRPGGDSVRSIHDTTIAKEKGFADILTYDRAPHLIFGDFVSDEPVMYDRSSIDNGGIRFEGKRLIKSINIEDRVIELKYRPVEHAGALSVEISLGLFENNVKINNQAYVKNREGSLDTDKFSILNPDRKYSIELEADGIFRVNYLPIETISMSESGIERNYQGTVFRLNFVKPPDLIMRTVCY